MKPLHKKIFNLAIKYLEKWLNKDFIIHTKGVIKSMELILKNEKWNPDLLIPASILHDVWWANVPENYQKTKNKEDKLIWMKLHIKYAPKIIKYILKSLNYDKKEINKIIEIVKSHKFKNPRSLNKRLLIDADQLSDSFKKQFYSDVESYNITPLDSYNIRINNNKFYTKTAFEIFQKEMNKRKKEIEKNIIINLPNKDKKNS